MVAHTWEDQELRTVGAIWDLVSNNSDNTVALPLYLDPSSLVLQGSSFQPSACRTRSTAPEHLCITFGPTSGLSLTQIHSSADTSLLGPVRGWEEKPGLVFYNSIKTAHWRMCSELAYSSSRAKKPISNCLGPSNIPNLCFSWNSNYHREYT